MVMNMASEYTEHRIEQAEIETWGRTHPVDPGWLDNRKELHKRARRFKQTLRWRAVLRWWGLR